MRLAVLQVSIPEVLNNIRTVLTDSFFTDTSGKIGIGDILVSLDALDVRNMEPAQLAPHILGPVPSIASCFSREYTGQECPGLKKNILGSAPCSCRLALG